MKNKEKKKNRKGRIVRRIILLSILAIFLAGIGYCAYKFLPVYNDAKEKTASVMEDMNEDTFLHVGNTKIYNKDGTLIGQIGNEKYEYVPYSEISDYIKNGYVSVEDKTFYENDGVDYEAILRAVLVMIKNKGEITQGGSTITQQLVKNTCLTQEQTFERKVTEMLIAKKVDENYSKDKIMEYYCNSNYYGSGCYGVQSAAKYYFGKNAKDLTLAEAAILVGTSNSPNANNPAADYEKAMAKKKSVLRKMLDDEVITQEEYDVAIEERPEVVKEETKVESDSYEITYAVHCATLLKMEHDGFEFKYIFENKEDEDNYKAKYQETYDTAKDVIRNEGYEIHTSLDPSIQEMLQEAVDEELEDFDETQDDGRYEMQGAAVCIDNQTQMVVAIVGGRGEDDYFNRGFQAKRQPGSSIKPLLDYGPAINENRILPSTIIDDHPFEVDGYSPKNSGSYYGDITVREALARSLNTVAFQVYMETGPKTSLSYLEKLHFGSLSYADNSAYAASIGALTYGATVADMARGYATLANNGAYSNKTCITSIDHLGKTVYSIDKSAKDSEVYTPETTFILTDMMQGVFNESYGTARKYRNRDQVYAGKTGTTNDNKDAWFCGFSKYYTTAVWCGCDTPERVYGLYGNAYPARIWSSFMDDLHEDLEYSEFEPTENVVLINKKEKIREIPYDSDFYDNRKEYYGWDYASIAYLEAKEKTEEQDELEEIKKDVLDFLSMSDVSTYHSVQKFEREYEKAKERVNGFDTNFFEEDKDILLKKIEEHYTAMESRIAEIKAKEEQKQSLAGNEQTVYESETIKEPEYSNTNESGREQDFHDAINKVYSASTYTNDVYNNLVDAYNILIDIDDTDEFNRLYEEYEDAIRYANSLQ